MRQFGLSDHVALKQDHSLYGHIQRTHTESNATFGGVDTMLIAHVEVPSDALREFLETNMPPEGYVYVEFASSSTAGASLVSENDIVLVSRAFRLGETVKQDGGTMTGTVIDLSEKYILEPVFPTGSSAAPACSSTCPSTLPEFFAHPNPHILLYDVPAVEVKRALDIIPEDCIIWDDWVGAVADVEYDTVVMLSDSSIVIVWHSYGVHTSFPEQQKPLVAPHLPSELEGIVRLEALAASQGWSDDSPSARPQRGDFVYVDRSALQTARWLSGKFSMRGPREGIVLDYRSRHVTVDWIARSLHYDPRDLTMAPRKDMTIYHDVQCRSGSPEVHLKDGLIIYDTGRMQTRPSEAHSIGDEAGPTLARGQAAYPGINSSTNIYSGQELEVGMRVKFRDPSAAAEKYQGIAGTSHGKFLRATKYESHDWHLNELKIVYMQQYATVMWQDGSVATVNSTSLTTFTLFETEILPTDIVLKRAGTRQRPTNERGKVGGPVKVFDEVTFLERPHDLLPAGVGVVQSVDPTEKVARVRWYKNPKIELRSPDQRLAPDSRFGPMGDEVEDVSLFEIMCFPSLLRRRTDICVVRAPGPSKVSHNHIRKSRPSSRRRMSGARQFPYLFPSQDSRNSKGEEEHTEELDWVGQIVSLGLDGSIAVRLGAAQPCRDVLMDADGIITVIGGGHDWDDDHSIDSRMDLDSWSGSGSLFTSAIPWPISETVEYEGGERLDNDSDDENWTSEEDDALEGDDEVLEDAKEERPEKGTDLEMLDAEEQPSDAAAPPTPLFQLEKALGSEPPAQFLVLEQEPPLDHFKLRAPRSSLGIARIIREHRILENSLPKGEIYVCTYESRLDLLRCLIVGPRDTPYEHAPFLIDLYLPREFPDEPPVAHFHSWTSGLGRINPNLYEEGKICLSLLGTWSGRQESEKWRKDATILQVLVSLQGLVFVKRPFYNEAGYEGYEHDNVYATESDSYSEKAFVMARGFVKSALLRPPGGLEDVLAWLYLPRDASHPTQSLLGTVVERGRLLLQRSEEARSNQDESLVDSAGAKADETRVFLKPLSRGASVMLRRLIDELQTLLDQYLAERMKFPVAHE